MKHKSTYGVPKVVICFIIYHLLSTCWYENVVPFLFQLQQVDAALKAADTENNDDLVKLRADLGELILLTEGDLLCTC